MMLSERYSMFTLALYNLVGVFDYEEWAWNGAVIGVF